jgi:aspartate-semialdehyde dehydrogenase
MSDQLRVAIIGATGAVGREMINDLEECDLKNIELGLFASRRSAGQKLRFRDKTHEVKLFSAEDLKGFDYILMSAGGGFSKDYAQILADQGSLVIDNSSAWRMDNGVQLIVPEVNGDKILGMKTGIIANPNCSTIQMVVALKPLKDSFGMQTVNVATYQSVSGSGQNGITELSQQLADQMKFQDLSADLYDQVIAFNLLPAIDVLTDDRHCNEEVKMVKETQKIFTMPKLTVFASTVRVPTFHCHGEAVTVQLGEAVTRQQAEDAIAEGEGINLVRENDHTEFPTPRSVTGDKQVHVSRVRLPVDSEKSDWVQFWNVADNLKKGAATNAVQILSLAASSR